MPTLNNYSVLITRSHEQSKNLYHLIETAGGMAECLPLIEILPVIGDAITTQLTSSIKKSSHVIFISRNAVKYAWQLKPDLTETLSSRKILAVGAGTKQALSKQGLDNIIFTDSTTGSEALLQEPLLSEQTIKDAVITIMRGGEGRQLLAKELQARGAAVSHVNVYQRKKPEINPEKLHVIWHDLKPDAIIITSVTGLENLIDLTMPEDRPVMYQKQLIVMSERIKQAALNAGFKEIPIVPKTATDQGLFQAVVLCQELSS